MGAQIGAQLISEYATVKHIQKLAFIPRFNTSSLGEKKSFGEFQWDDSSNRIWNPVVL